MLSIFFVFQTLGDISSRPAAFFYSVASSSYALNSPSLMST